MGYQFGPFHLDLAKRRLWRGDELVPLTPKVIDTLFVLVTRAGKVVEKDEIFRAVWPDVFVEEATLAQNVSTLRKALGDTSETPTYIATAPRRGYRFLASVTETVNTPPDPYGESPTAIANAAQTADGLSAEPDSVVAAGPRHVTPAAGRRARERFWMAVSAALALGLIVVGLRAIRAPSAPVAPVVFAISPPEGTAFSPSGSVMAISPDGRTVGFLAFGPDGTNRLWLRPLDSPVAHALAGSEGAAQPFWSLDSQYVAFFADGKLKRVGLAGGAAETICTTPIGAQPLAGTWNSRGDILFASLRQGILRVPASGGIATLAIPKDPADDHVTWPQFLPDERHFLYAVSSKQPDRSGIYVGALDSTERIRIVATRSSAAYASSGHLLFVQNGTLTAQPFDAVNLRLTGNPVPLADRVAFNAGSSRATFSLSNTGVLAYRTVGDSRLVWFDRTGTSLGPVGSVGGYLHFSVSPDNTKVAAARLDPQTGTSDIWIIDGAAGSERRLTFERSWETYPLWSRDASNIAFASDRRGRWEIYVKASSGNGPEQPLLQSDTSAFPYDWSWKGGLLFKQWDPNQKTKGDFWLLAPGSDTKPIRLPDLESDEQSGRISPDGRWLAYEGWESGWSVYVRSLQSTESRWQISPPGGVEPRWRADGRELFFLSPDLSVMAMEIEPGTTFRAGPPRHLFQTQALAPSGVTGQAYDVTSDGQRFLVKVLASFSPITVVVNWASLLQNPR